MADDEPTRCRRIWDRLKRYYSVVVGWVIAVWGRIVSAGRKIESWGAGVLLYISTVDASPTDGVDELRSRLGVLVAASLAMAGILVASVPLEHLRGGIGTVIVFVVYLTRAEEGAIVWVPVLVILTFAALTILRVALTSVRYSRVSNDVGARNEGDPEREDNRPLHNT
ncbi:hypothetical protein ACHAQJ_007455 [Trichoderma viride]